MLPMNIWTITTAATDTATRIADQPADASLSTPNIPDKGLLRYIPIWSPDGMHVAWLEKDFSDQTTSRLMLYDKTTQTTRVLVSRWSHKEVLSTHFGGVWTDNGIVIFSRAPGFTMPNGETIGYTLFDAVTGEEKFSMTAAPILLKDEMLEPGRTLPVQYQGKTWLGVLYAGVKTKAGARWRMLDLDTGKFTGETANIVGYATDHAESSLRVIPVVPLDRRLIQYVIQQANGVIVPFSDDPNQQISQFAFSPDGEAIAYQLYDTQTYKSASTIYIWRDGVITTVPQTEFPAIIQDFVWGSITWEVGAEGPGIGAPGS